MTEGRLFEFDTIDATLDLVPLAARRLLDALGAKLSLEGWQSLPIVDRQTILQLGSAASIDEARARDVLTRATPLPRAIDPIGDPSMDAVPPLVVALLGAQRTLSVTVWSNLEPLERWVLDKVAHSKNPERLPRAYDEILGKRQGLTHLNAQGEAHMVDTATKPVSARRAVAASTVTLSVAAHRALIEGNAAKGDVLGTARIAAIMAAKQTSQLIPLCHPIQLTHIDVTLVPSSTDPTVDIRAEVTAVDRTGVEMEAMVAVSVAALTIYDMLKAVDRGIVIGPTRLLEKSGGKSGDYRA
jgi:cyclic pyranopterin monophosphate synthase